MKEISKKTDTLKKWEVLYKPLEAGIYIPTADPFGHLPDTTAPTKVVVRDMIVDMEKLNTDLANKARLWNELEVYADVLVFPRISESYGEAYGDNFAFKLGGVGKQRATFFARSIIITDGSAAFANFNKETQLTIYTAGIDGGDLFISGLDGDLRQSATLNLPAGALGLSLGGSDMQPRALMTLPAEILAHGSPAYWLLESSFNVGCALAHTQQQLAGRIFSWISHTAGFGEDIDAQQLALSAANMQGFVKQLQRRIPFVPVLSEQVYRELSTVYLEAAATFETTFNAQVNALGQVENVDDFVRANKEYFIDKTGVSKKLIEQMQNNIDSAEVVLKQNSGKLNDLVRPAGVIDMAKQSFQEGVEKYKEDQKKKAIIGVCTAILEVGASIAAMAAGDEAAVETAATGAVDIAKEAKAAKEEVSRISALIETMKKIAKVIKELAELIEKLKEAREAISKVVEVNNLKSSDFGKGIKVQEKTGDSDVFDNAYWEEFKITMGAILTPYTSGDTSIDGAGEYMEQLKILAVYGEAMYANQITVTQLRQKLFQLVLEEEVSRNQRGRLEMLVKKEETREELLQRAKIIAYQNLLRVKSRIVFYMDEQAAAYRYWSAGPELKAEWLPSFGDTVGELREKLAQLDEGRVTAMEIFNPTPQPMDLVLEIVQPELIEQMRTSGQLSWTIPIDQKEFSLFGRVRVSRFRVFLNDEAVLDPDKTIIIEVATTSHYYDRTRGKKVLEYVSGPFHKPFEYQLGRKDKPIADGTIAREFEFSYFEPTPFTTWTIKVTKDSPVDLSKLKTVSLELTGSWAAL